MKKVASPPDFNALFEKYAEDLPVLLKSATGILAFFLGVIFVLFYTPLRDLILMNVMGLTWELSRYTVPGLKLIFILAVFGGISSVFRGILSAYDVKRYKDFRKCFQYMKANIVDMTFAKFHFDRLIVGLVIAV